QEATLVPVLIHVHGGSNEVGMGAMLHADVLASRGQFVVVTFNYRLGAFGFFHSPTLDIPANLGLHDQLLVFKWVQQNIGQFGGDPNKVTIQGHSAGSVDVGIHLLSPASSGHCMLYVVCWVLRVGCWMLYVGCWMFQHGDEIFYFTASVDGFFLLDHPIKLLDRRTHRQTGTLNGEALLMVFPYVCLQYMLPPPPLFPPPNDMLNTSPTYEDQIKLVHFVYKPWSDPYNVTANFIRLSDLIGDITFTAPTIQTADYLSRSNRTQLYVYSFEHRSDSSIYPQWMGVPHGDDLFHVFGTPLEGSRGRNFTARDRLVSQAVMDLWIHFVKHG
ncbi:unnamed protein product, partial [Candidula unifasciata]